MYSVAAESDRDEVVPAPNSHWDLVFGAPDDLVGDKERLRYFEKCASGAAAYSSRPCVRGSNAARNPSPTNTPASIVKNSAREG